MPIPHKASGRVHGDIRIYAHGLLFSCTACSACCRYEPGYVFLSAEDTASLAAVKGVVPHEFEQMYCRWVWWTDEEGKPVQRLSLRERTSSAGGRPSEDCVFWQDGCTVYEARPLQCRTYPFWSEALASKKTWRETARSCPGIGRGARHSREEIEGLLALERAQRIIMRPVPRF